MKNNNEALEEEFFPYMTPNQQHIMQRMTEVQTISPQDIRRDDYKKNIVHVFDQVDISVLQEKILQEVQKQEQNNTYYAQGFNGRTYLVNIGKGKKVLIVKSNHLKELQGNKKTLHEYQFHMIARNALTKHGDDCVDTPDIYGSVHDNDGNIFLVMEYIEGLTLFSFKLLSVLEYIYQAHGNKKDLQVLKSQFAGIRHIHENDTYIKSLFIKTIDAMTQSTDQDIMSFVDTYVNSRVQNRTKAKRIGGVYMEAYMANIFGNIAKKEDIGYFPPETVRGIKDNLLSAIEALNEGDVHHNDLNQRNIILGRDGKVYIIDFDKSGHKKSSFKEKNYRLSKRMEYPKYNGKTLQYDYECLEYFDSLAKREGE